MQRCSGCRAEVPVGARYCANCGALQSSASQMPTAYVAGGAAAEGDVAAGGAQGLGRGAGALGAGERSPTFRGGHGEGQDTRTSTRRPSPPHSPSASPSHSIPIGRLHASSSSGSIPFAPGQLIAGRYRMIGLLGQGGMGEVYRVDDLKLGQPVSLKFLPASLAADPERLDRFLAEVRLSRQVSHPNVCRVYDIGETDGSHFLTMEYVDGEDLATLLRRIGRLPGTKAHEIARQICAGLAAAHDKKVLHRDLKPSNIMIDGSGRARITDFGLAIHSDEAAASGFAGTPAYMAPEQFRDEPLTERADIYSLGLVLYELYTGHRVFEAASFADWKERHTRSVPTPPSGMERDIDEAAERVILRCLEKDPAKRPASALQVAAALPGGDPLAAALAAGETPSPEMVAAAGGEGAISLPHALALTAGILVAWVSIFLISPYSTDYGLSKPTKSPEVLSDRARQIATRFGYDARPVDSGAWMNRDYTPMLWLSKNAPSTQWRASMHDWPPAVLFYHRQSPRWMKPPNSVLAEDEPPHEVSGMAKIVLDGDGNLREFRGVPPQKLVVMESDPTRPVATNPRSPSPAAALPAAKEPAARPAERRLATGDQAATDPEPTVPLVKTQAESPMAGARSGETEEAFPRPDWKAAFAEAGLPFDRFTPVTPTWVPPAAFDAWEEWTGSAPWAPDVPLRASASAFRGRLVSFEVLGPWSTPQRMQVTALSASRRIAQTTIGFSIALVMALGAFLVRRNLKRARGDQRGARRLGLFVFVCQLISLVAGAHHVGELGGEALILIDVLAKAVASGVIFGLLYIAVEPYARGRMPELLIGWARLLEGRIRDPRVGRDILAGTLVGGLMALCMHVTNGLPTWIPIPGQTTIYANTDIQFGGRHLLASITGLLIFSLGPALTFFGLLLLFRILLRRPTLAMLALMATLTLTQLGGENFLLETPGAVFIGILASYAIARFGFLTAVTIYFVYPLLFTLPLPLSSYYAVSSLIVIVLLFLIAAYAFRVSIGRRALFASVLEG